MACGRLARYLFCGRKSACQCGARRGPETVFNSADEYAGYGLAFHLAQWPREHDYSGHAQGSKRGSEHERQRPRIAAGFAAEGIADAPVGSRAAQVAAVEL